MYIPKEMNQMISKAFYDKTIELVRPSTSIDVEGGIVFDENYEVLQTFNGNVSFSNCKKIQEEYGLDYQVDIAITCARIEITKNDMVKYEGVVYDISDILPFDSHLVIVGTKWQR